MKISAIIPSGDPIKLNYQTLFACLQSSAKIFDEIILADSGIEETSYALFPHAARAKIVKVQNNVTKWDVTAKFSPNQVNDMVNEVLKTTDSEWLFFVPADHVLTEFSLSELKDELALLKTEYWVRIKRFKMRVDEDKKCSFAYDSRMFALNLCRLKELKQFPYVMGVNEKNNIILDFPILASGFCGLINQNGAKIIVPKGDFLCGGVKTLSSIEAFVADHFFYTYEQAVAQRLSFFESFNSRANGSAMLRCSDIQRMIHKEKKKCLSKDELLAMEFPSEFREVLKNYYREDILGRFVDNMDFYFYKNLLAVERRLRTVLYRSLGYRGVFESVDWHDCPSKLKSFKSLEGIWEAQDRVSLMWSPGQ